MKRIALLMWISLFAVPTLAPADQSPPVSGVVRNISLYQNYLQRSRKMDTQTLSLYALYSWQIKGRFLTELTVDINGDIPDNLYSDYYLEFQLIKPLGKGLSVRAEDAQGTFTDRIVRLGLGYDF